MLIASICFNKYLIYWDTCSLRSRPIALHSDGAVCWWFVMMAPPCTLLLTHTWVHMHQRYSRLQVSVDRSHQPHTFDGFSRGCWLRHQHVRHHLLWRQPRRTLWLRGNVDQIVLIPLFVYHSVWCMWFSWLHQSPRSCDTTLGLLKCNPPHLLFSFCWLLHIFIARITPTWITLSWLHFSTLQLSDNRISLRFFFPLLLSQRCASLSPILNRQGKADIGLPTINSLISHGLACWCNGAIGMFN